MISATFKPFNPKVLQVLLKSHDGEPLRLKSRENSRVEFKESFNFGSKDAYAKTMAAFANTSGGYLIFGVKDKPRDVIGLQNTNFEEFDPAKLTEFLNSALSPEIEWEPQTIDFHSRKLGLIYVWELKSKPVVCTKNSGADLREAEIYYRYRGRSERIKYPELTSLLEGEREKERNLWKAHLENISRIGVSNAAVLNTTTGLVSGPGGSFLITEDLIPKLAFIREGRFRDGGAPTLKLVGTLQSFDAALIAPTEVVVQHRALNLSGIVMAFLEQRRVDNPTDYIEEICFNTTAYLPVHFFMKQAELSVEDTIKLIGSIPSRQPSRGKLVDRLQSGDKVPIGSVVSETPLARKRREYLVILLDRRIPEELPSDDVMLFCQAITHMDSEDVDPKILFPFVADLFSRSYSMANGPTSNAMRRAICHLDSLLFS